MSILVFVLELGLILQRFKVPLNHEYKLHGVIMIKWNGMAHRQQQWCHIMYASMYVYKNTCMIYAI